MRVQMRANLVAVKKLAKPTNRTDLGGLISMPEVADNQGVVRYLGPEVKGLKEGQRIFYGNKRTEIRMNGEDVLVMEDDNVYAIVEESEDEGKTT